MTYKNIWPTAEEMEETLAKIEKLERSDILHPGDYDTINEVCDLMATAQSYHWLLQAAEPASYLREWMRYAESRVAEIIGEGGAS